MKEIIEPKLMMDIFFPDGHGKGYIKSNLRNIIRSSKWQVITTGTEINEILTKNN